MNQEHFKSILKHYLGAQYGVRLFPTDIAEFRKKFPRLRSAFIRARQPKLRAIGCYHLMEWGWQKYRHLFTYQFVDMYLSTGTPEGEGETFHDTETPLLLIYHMAGTMENKQLENLVAHTISQRNVLGLRTHILAETPPPKVEATC